MIFAMADLTEEQLSILGKNVLNGIPPKSHSEMIVPQRVDSVKQLQTILNTLLRDTEIAVVYNYYGDSKPPVNVVDAYFSKDQAKQMVLESERLGQNKCYYLASGTVKEFEEGTITHRNMGIPIMQGLNKVTIYMSLLERIL